MIEVMSASGPFTPDWALPPGESILDMMQERGWKQTELATRLGYSEKHLSQLVNGAVSITPDAAQKLASVFGSSTDFWLMLQANYQKHKVRLQTEQRHAQWVSWLDILPVKDLMNCQAISKQRMTAKNKPALVQAILQFFGVASPHEWRAHYGDMQMAFRRNRLEQADVGAISAWLRLGERQAERLTIPKYDKEKFEQALREIRNMTCEKPEYFISQMKRLLQGAGVSLVFVPSIARAHVSGVARWLGPTRPLIQISLYGKTNDRFWFTFFHEAAHILLHAEQDRKSIFLDDKNLSLTDDPLEREANEWAGNLLIPSHYASDLDVLNSKNAVIDFARHIGVHPGIVVGRLQHDEKILMSWMNGLKQSLALPQ